MSEIRERRTSQDRMRELSKDRLEVGKNSLSYFGPQIYNGIFNKYKVLSCSSLKENLKLALETELLNTIYMYIIKLNLY